MYKFKYRRRLFWKTIKVIGHHFVAEQDKMCLYLEDGSVREIKEWTKCECQLGVDWVNMTKKQLEKEAGISIPLTV